MCVSKGRNQAGIHAICLEQVICLSEANGQIQANGANYLMFRVVSRMRVQGGATYVSVGSAGRENVDSSSQVSAGVLGTQYWYV
jgi:hypothetical protein